jgi:hypothetical protein
MQLRMYKKAKEKVKLNAISSVKNILNNAQYNLNNFKSFENEKVNASVSTTLNAIYSIYEASLIDLFFELESDMEKSVCRDCISSNSSEREIGLFLFYVIYLVRS